MAHKVNYGYQAQGRLTLAHASVIEQIALLSPFDIRTHLLLVNAAKCTSEATPSGIPLTPAYNKKHRGPHQ
jgi:hypothetical protein